MMPDPIFQKKLGSGCSSLRSLINDYPTEFSLEQHPLLPESERVCLDTGVKEFDLECSIHHLSSLSNELIEARFLDLAGSVRLGVYSVMITGRTSIQPYGVTDRLVRFGWTQHHMQITSMEPE